jgi:predicted MFS family arabinose efflux permease
MNIMLMVPPAKLAVAWLTMFLIGTELFVFAPFLPMLAAYYHTSAAMAGLSVTVFSAAYMVSAPVFGHFSDQIGRRRVLSCALLAFAAANLLTACAANLPWLLAVRLLAGIAAAGVSPSTRSLVVPLHPIAAPPGWRWWYRDYWLRSHSARRLARCLAHCSVGRLYSSRSLLSAWCSYG